MTTPCADRTMSQGLEQPTMGYAPAPISLGSSVMKFVLPQGFGCLSPGCQSGCGWDFQLTPCGQTQYHVSSEWLPMVGDCACHQAVARLRTSLGPRPFKNCPVTRTGLSCVPYCSDESATVPLLPITRLEVARLLTKQGMADQEEGRHHRTSTLQIFRRPSCHDGCMLAVWDLGNADGVHRVNVGAWSHASRTPERATMYRASHYRLSNTGHRIALADLGAPGVMVQRVPVEPCSV